MDDLRPLVMIANSVSDIHKKNAAESARDYKLCAKYADLSRYIAISIPASYSIVTIIYQFPTFMDIFTKGIIRPSASIYLPGVNECDTIDMTALLLVNVMLVTLGIVIYLASETFIYINFVAIPMLSAIVQRQINDFKHELEGKKKAVDFKRTKKQLIEIIEMQLEYNK